MHHKVHRYEIGARLLCFEPDTSKAKLIYFAKERNRHKRKERIDLVLQNASLCGDDVDWDSIPGVWKQSVKAKSNNAITQHRCNEEEVSEPEKPCFTFDDLELNLTDSEESMQFEFENLQAHELFYVPFPLTPRLALFVDAHAIVGPAELSAVNFGWSSLVQVLQAYLDGFPYQNLNVPNGILKDKSTGAKAYERSTRQLVPAYTKTDRSRLICAEVCSSLRVLFDCMADDYLILSHEKASIVKYPLCKERFPDSRRAFEIPKNTISVLKSDSSESSTPLPRYELLPNVNACKTPDLPCLVYPAHILLRLFDNLPDILKDMQMSSCRRSIISRHLYMLTQYLDVTRSFWFSKDMPDCIEHLLPSYEPLDVKQGESKTKSGTIVPRQSRQKVRIAKSETSSADTEPLMYGQTTKSVHRVYRGPASSVVPHGSRICHIKKPQSESLQQPRFSLRSHDDQSRKISEPQATNTVTSMPRHPHQQEPTSSFLRRKRQLERRSDLEDKMCVPLTPPKTRISACLSTVQKSDAVVNKEEEKDQDEKKQLTLPMTRSRASLFNSTGGRSKLRPKRLF